ncbi:MAG: nucleotidyltransferase substrate binding protein [Desulfobacteraceae bacterium]|nr:nucleotidyltransferase substrate binding protein [Desulfobacteraceae bacterium]
MNNNNQDIRWKQRFQNFEKAYHQFNDAVSSVDNLSVLEKEGMIQRFEYTFELAWKAMKRTLKEEGSEIGSPKQVFRSAFEAKLIDNLEQWFALLKERNLTVHTYNEETAKEVYESAKSFPKVVDQLIYNLENR